jgi:hypothetical protein
MKFRLRVLSRPISTRSTPVTGCCANSSRAASFSRRRVRLRTTAFPTFLVTVKPNRAGKVSARGRAWRTTPPTAAFLPADATRRNSARRFRRLNVGVSGVATSGFPTAEFRSIWGSVEAGMVGTPALGASGGQLLAALGTAVGQDLATANGLHTGAKSMPALADQLGRLIGALHDYSPKTIGTATRLPVPLQAYRRVRLRWATRREGRVIRTVPPCVNLRLATAVAGSRAAPR